MTRARFITLEGGEGAGKSTLIKHLTHFLKEKGIPYIATREPGGVEGSEKIRQLLVTGEPDQWDPKTEVLLMYAARWEHFKKLILPSLQKGIWVISDRFADSTTAYQGYGHGVELEFIDQLYAHLMGQVYPDLTFVLSLSPRKGLERAQRRMMETLSKEDRFEKNPLSFHERVFEGFIEIASRYPERCFLLDGEEDIETLKQTVIETITKRFLREKSKNERAV